MLGVTINYKKTVSFLTKELCAEWAYMPFQDYLEKQRLLDEVKKNGIITVEGESYNQDDLQVLIGETEGAINEFSFKPGGCEGYMLLIRMASGQILKSKLWDRDALEKFLCWINHNEAADRVANRKRMDEPIPVGSVVYVVDGYPDGMKIIPHRVESREATTDNPYPLHLKDVNPDSQGTYNLAEGWERWDFVFFRIEDAIEAAHTAGSKRVLANV
jgi:hypothetical protein